jgi:predicted O-linked N-acetylglucosamine transferase (SPINDLY family)
MARTAVSRAGRSQLSNLGLTELAATTADQFVGLAAGLATDIPRLADLRPTLRPRMEQSPLMDAPRFVRGIEAAFRAMWQSRCETPGRDVPQGMRRCFAYRFRTRTV